MGSRPHRESSLVLVVEGGDDQAVAESLLRSEGSEVRFEVRRKRSVGALIKSMGAEAKAPGRTAVGFVLDANSDPGSRWSDVARVLQSVRPVPERPDRDGTVLPGSPRVGVWMMPDNGSAGELEDFMANMRFPDDPVWPLAEEYISGLPDSLGHHARSHLTKAVLHAWLATKRKPGRMGAVIEDGELATSDELPQRFVSWLRKLFDEQDPD